MTDVEFGIERLTSNAALSTCASLMATSNPWNKLYFSKKQCETELSRSGIAVYGAIGQDGVIHGFLASASDGIGFEPLIENLCVDANFRSMGIGTRLIRYFEEELFPDADNLYLFVSDINPKAIRLYVRLGYAQVGALPNFNLEKQTEFLHRKTRRPRQEARMTAQRGTETWDNKG